MGELTYTAPVIGGGNGTGTASDPAVVHYGEMLSVEVSQKTSYTDPNGEVFSCEPKAVIKLSVAKDTLYAKDLQAPCVRHLYPRQFAGQVGRIALPQGWTCQDRKAGG